jgi:hypothetical protein
MYIDQLLTSDQDNTGADLLEDPAPPPHVSAGLHINLIPDASVANAPAGFASEVRQAADIIEANFSDPITLNIGYGWGTYNNRVDPQLTGGNFAEGGDNFQTHQNVAYSTLRSWLTADASSTQDNTALAHLPSTLANSFYVTSAQLRALGHFSGNASDLDGFIGWGTAWTSNFVGGALHELTHAMGRIFQDSSDYIMNLFRYDAPGHFQWTGRQPAYLSIDGGSTRLADFGVSTDFGDFLPGGVQGSDPFNERVSGNNNLTPVDITTMDGIGFDRATGTPPPTTDDFANSLTDGTHPFGVLGATGAATGTLERTGDHDWFRVQLVAGTMYVINLQGQYTGAGTLQDPYLRVYNSTGGFVAENDDVGGGNLDSRLTFSSTTTGTYYLDAGAFADSYAGTYRISVNGAADDFANSLNDVAHPFGSVPINGSSAGTLETTGDRDWFRVQLVAGTSYLIDLQGQHAGAGTLEDPYLRVHDANGNLLAESDDIVLGINRDSELTFQAGTTGTYYLEAGAFADNYTGTYRLSIAGGNHPPTPLIQDFDPNFYLSTYRDVAAAVPAGQDPAAFALQHYNTYGWHEGRNPDADFNTAAYLNTYRDVRAAGVNPLQHYENNGWREGRDPSAQFSTSLYLLHNPDVRAAGIDPLQHYLQNGIAEGRAAPAAIGHGGEIGDFDPHYYLLANPDVAAAVPAGADPNAFALQHYNTYGWHEGRNPNADFSTTGYLSTYTDVRNAGVNPLDHYHAFGWHEGRDPSPQFDTGQYLAHYTDVAAAHIDPLQHYLTNGAWENRLTFGDGHFG